MNILKIIGIGTLIFIFNVFCFQQYFLFSKYFTYSYELVCKSSFLSLLPYALMFYWVATRKGKDGIVFKGFALAGCLSLVFALTCVYIFYSSKQPVKMVTSTN